MFNEHSEKDFVFFSLLRKHIKSQMITNEGGRAVSRNMFITQRSGHFTTQTQKCWYDFQAFPKLQTDLVSRPAQCEPKEQKFGMVFYDIVPPWSVALGDPAVRVGRTTPLSRTVAARSWNQEKTEYWIGLPEALHTIRATRIPDLVAWQNSQTLQKLRPEGSKHF